MKKQYQCECCGCFFPKREMSTHHIYPKEWYHGSGPTVEVCLACHREFEKANPHNFVWTTIDCALRWLNFVKSQNAS